MKKKLTEFYVLNAMTEFLHRYYLRRYEYGTLQEILCELSPLPKGGTSNPAVWEEWIACINKSLENGLNTVPFGEAADRTYTNLQAFDAMVDFFIAYYKRTLSGDLWVLMHVIVALPKKSADQKSWNDWNNAVKKALQKKVVENPIDETAERRLTKLQAFNAMVKFLSEYYKETAADFVDLISSSMCFLYDGDTADPAHWEDWSYAIRKILKKQDSKKSTCDETLGMPVTESQAFQAMIQFFKYYYERGQSSEITVFFNYLHLLPDDNSSSPIIRAKWKKFVDIALKEKPGDRHYLTLIK